MKKIISIVFGLLLTVNCGVYVSALNKQAANEAFRQISQQAKIIGKDTPDTLVGKVLFAYRSMHGLMVTSELSSGLADAMVGNTNFQPRMYIKNNDYEKILDLKFDPSKFYYISDVVEQLRIVTISLTQKLITQNVTSTELNPTNLKSFLSALVAV